MKNLLSQLLRLMSSTVLPGGGFLFAAWSPSTTLALYWIDTLVGAFAMAMRISLHRRWTHAAGHFHAQMNAEVSVRSKGQLVTRGYGSFLQEYFTSTLVFTLAHGLMLAFLLAMLLGMPDTSVLEQGAVAIVACHGLSLGIDTFTVGSWPFAKMKQIAMKQMGRVVLVHLSIIGGMFYFAWRDEPGAFFSVFVWLKGLADVGSFLPEWNPKEPPRWLARLMNRIPSKEKGTFEEFWRREDQRQAQQAARDETPVDAP